MSNRPSFKYLSLEQQLRFGNGIGPHWLPATIRRCITVHASWFFRDASWRHHDFGYAIGRTEAERWEYDWKFFRAMVKDALSQRPGIWWFAAPIALFISVAFYLAVMIGGWLSFRYGDRYLTIEEALSLNDH